MEIQKKKWFYKKFIGEKVKVLVETNRTKRGLLKGITSNYLPVLINGKDNLKNRIVDVRITKLIDTTLFGNVSI